VKQDSLEKYPWPNLIWQAFGVNGSFRTGTRFVISVPLEDYETTIRQIHDKV
jgi:hypothetical protein